MTGKKMILPSEVELIIDLINRSGHRADIVGGCTRDFLLGKCPSDYDITTDATPEQMREIFRDYRTIDTGIRHGTLSVIVNGEQYEITTYRLDGDYKDHRHPDNVSFTRNLYDDLSRRDFTMNAICYNPTDGFTDRFSGCEDIKGGIIRAVGDPTRRFREDALRILRAVRFSATLGFDIEKNTANAVKAERNLLANVSMERTYTEWKKLVMGNSALRVMDEYNDVISVFIPELEEITAPDEHAFYTEDFLIRSCAIFKLSTKDYVKAFSSAMSRLKSDTKTRKLGETVLENSDYCDTHTDIGLRKLLMDIGYEAADGVLRLRRMLKLEECGVIERLENIKNNSAWRIADLKINGNDLLAMGIKGERVGVILHSLLSAVVFEKCENEKSALIEMAERLKGVENGV